MHGIKCTKDPELSGTIQLAKRVEDLYPVRSDCFSIIGSGYCFFLKFDPDSGQLHPDAPPFLDRKIKIKVEIRSDLDSDPDPEFVSRVGSGSYFYS